MNTASVLLPPSPSASASQPQLLSSALPTQTDTPALALLPSTDEMLSCRLVGPFSIFVQVLVGTLGFSTLIIKRHFERPRRPWLVWGFDVSKQMIGGSLMHMCNLLVSALIGGEHAGEEDATNPCSWYVLNLTLDCTLGVLFMAGYLKLYKILADRLKITGLESGHYGDPPSWKRWLKQATLFCISMVSMKLTVILLITLLPILVLIGDGILKPVQLLDSPRFQIVFVMAVWPLILNIFESWVIDHFIKHRAPEGHVPLAEADEEEDFVRPMGAARMHSSFEMSATTSVGSRTLAGSTAIAMPATRGPRTSSIDISEFELDSLSDRSDDDDKSPNDRSQQSIHVPEMVPKYSIDEEDRLFRQQKPHKD
ncbi:hypothetical protein GGI15_003947 [Coemansia interrupta]|uniref:Vacuolar membrane protein n=1 Tax=Coemansia interrupta TaxID=1126814 RepID=A0A9W8H719_9FUNG|nr:hypothetical protein GGI15_003947 [Coemansia interrupta]